MKYIACNLKNYAQRETREIEFIVLHYTANNGDTAQGNCNYFANNIVGASAHYFVDENEVVKSVQEHDVAWHCETAGLPFTHKKCRNLNSIGIEMCSRKDENGNYYIKPETVANAIKFVRELMSKYNIPVSHVLRHYDVKPKICPRPWVEDERLWFEFLNKLEGKEMAEKRYNTIAELPEWAKSTIEHMVNCGKIADGNKLDLSMDMIRILVMMNR